MPTRLPRIAATFYEGPWNTRQPSGMKSRERKNRACSFLRLKIFQ
jgi:hypothetical protein